MIAPRAPQFAAAAPRSRVAGFRTKLLVAMMLVVSAVTALALWFAERNLVAGVERDLQRDFERELALRDRAEEILLATLAERCRALVRRPRIQEALEAYALDLLYPNAETELRDLVETSREPATATKGVPSVHAQFYRFLDAKGAVISAGDAKGVGELQPAEETRLALRGVTDRPQIGYLSRRAADGPARIAEIIATPIISTVTGEVIAALVLGFNPFEFGGGRATAGLWVDGQLHLASPHASAIAAETARVVASPQALEHPLSLSLDGVPHLLFCKQLNAGSRFPPAYEVCVYSLAELHSRQWQLRWQVVGSGAGLLLLGLLASQFLSRRLSEPVEKLAVDSERSARFSADASHQLKTPVTVLRAGLEEMLAHEKLTPEQCHEISALVHQTYRLSSLIEDLLLLSRMDAGRLKLEFAPVNLTQLIEASLDDLSAQPDDRGIEIETDFPPGLHIAGEKRFTAIIVQNLLENARKYNRRGGRIRLVVRAEDSAVSLTVANTATPIAPAAQAHIFERFHRGAIGENVPGYGLGLNLARELARLHQGELRLVSSDEMWTIFEARFRAATPATAPA